MSHPAFQINTITKSFESRSGTIVRALDGVSISAPQGSITCIVGPTGSGKTTLLRLTAGLEEPDAGSILLSGNPPCECKGCIGYITQQHSLMPWLTAFENVALPLRVWGHDKASVHLKVMGILSSLGLEASAHLYPYELSGGMKQRVALGRLLASEASYWLLDEPFSSLDERSQHSLQRLLVKLVAEHGLSVLSVTHSIDEAVYVADRVVVLSPSPGRIVDDFRLELSHPRIRLSAEYASAMERIRRGIESVLQGG